MMSPEDMELRNIYNEIRSRVEDDARSFGGKLVDVRCTGKREERGMLFLSYVATLDIGGMKRSYVKPFKTSVNADILDAIVSAGKFSDEIHIETIGRPRLF